MSKLYYYFVFDILNISLVSLNAFRKSVFPRSIYCNAEPGYSWQFCRLHSCGICRSSPVSGTVHPLCLRLFLAEGEADMPTLLQWLYIVTTWNRPWRGACPLNLEPDCSALGDIAPTEDLPLLSDMSLELLSMIRGYCASSLLWLPSTISSLRNELAASQGPNRKEITLLNIQSWTRNGELQLDHSFKNLERVIFCLTFDFRGLRRIQRFSRRPSGYKPGSDYLAFIIESAQRLSGVVVEFQVGYNLLAKLWWIYLTLGSSSTWRD